MRIVKKLEFDTNPDYQALNNCFKLVVVANTPFDWENMRGPDDGSNASIQTVGQRAFA